MLAEECTGGVKPFRSDPLQPQRLAALDGVQEVCRSRRAVANEQRVTVSSTMYSVVQKRRRLRANASCSRTASAWYASPASHNARNPALSMKTSAAAIEDAVDVRMRRGSFGTGLGTTTNAQEGIPGGILRQGNIQRLEPGGGFAPVREDQTLAPGDAAQHAFRFPAKLQHGDKLHKCYIKLNIHQGRSATGCLDGSNRLPSGQCLKGNGVILALPPQELAALCRSLRERAPELFE